MVRHMICHMNHFSTLVRHSSCIESYSSCSSCRNYRSYGSYKLLRIPTNPTRCLSVSTACVYIRDLRPTASTDSIQFNSSQKRCPTLPGDPHPRRNSLQKQKELRLLRIIISHIRQNQDGGSQMVSAPLLALLTLNINVLVTFK